MPPLLALDSRHFRPRLVLAFTLACIALVTLVLTIEAASRRERAIHYGQERVKLNNRIFAAYAQSSFDKYFLLARHLADEMKHGALPDDAELRRLIDLDRNIMDVLLLSPQGTILRWSGQGPIPRVADREYFAAVSAAGAPLTHISHPAQSRVHAGRWFIGLSQAVRSAGGELAGVAVVLLDLSFLARDTQEILRSGGQSLALVMLDGTTIIRLPGEGRHGEVVAMIAELRGQVPREAERTLVSPFDGQKRYGSSLRLENHDILATSTLTEAEVLADWEKSLHASVSMWLILVALLGSAGFTIWRLAQGNQRQMGRLRELSRELRTLATTDPLTQIANRRHFDELMRVELERARRNGAPLSLAIIDIDHFKRINDRFGHQTGDQALTGLVGEIQRSLRDTDIFARLGGEEFALLLPHTNVAGAHEFAERIRHLVEVNPIAIEGQPPLMITVSVGVAEWHVGEDDFDPVMGRADQALYDAKANGRNRVESRN